MATVYIFDSRGNNKGRTGHAALQLASGRYVSFHPLDPAPQLLAAMSSYKPRFSRSPEEDLNNPDYTLTDRVVISQFLPGEEAEMERSFDEIQHLGKNYQLFKMNCSTVVAKLLLVGASHRFIGDPLSGSNRRLGHQLSHFVTRSHEDRRGRLTEYALDLVESVSTSIARALGTRSGTSPRALPVIMGAVVAGEAVVRHFVWTPGDVLELATHIQQKLPHGNQGDGGDSRGQSGRAW